MINNLLSRLDGVKKTGPDKYMAKCPAHADRSPSLGVRELADDRILINCFGGCSTESVLDSIGLTFSDLFPKDLHDNYRAEKRPFPAMDVLKSLVHEITIVSIAGNMLTKGKQLESVDMARLHKAHERITTALTYIGGA